MKQYFCNPVNIDYRYQFNRNLQNNNAIEIAREAADPSMITYKGKYYIFASMNLSVWESDDMVNWVSRRLPDNLPLYDYAPDVRVIGDYVYFSASKRGEVCNFYRTTDVVNGPYEEIKGTFDFWDPNLFVDDDGRVYFYWGCSNITPLYGVELDRETMKPLGEKKGLIYGDVYTKGYERVGEDNTIYPITGEELEKRFEGFYTSRGMKTEDIPPDMLPMIKGFISQAPYIEGPWMDKHQGKYYLQYACNGAQYNIYADGVYVSDDPLGPFTLALNNPYSYKPGGFLPGAGHGSTMEDRYGNLWHTSTMRISMNHQFERRVGIWPAGYDADGELYCDQRYGDWPLAVEQGKMDAWQEPEWYLLSPGKRVTASSYEEGKEPEKSVEENVRTWWRAASHKAASSELKSTELVLTESVSVDVASNESASSESVSIEAGEWIQVDLGEKYDVHAIQINFADDKIDIAVPGEIRGTTQARYIEEADYVTRWILEGSIDGNDYFVIKDKSKVMTNLPHDLVVIEEGKKLRYIKLTILEIPYNQQPCISGLRIFGKGNGEKPEVPEYTAVRVNDIDMDIVINDNMNNESKNKKVIGYNILWGHKPEKLYHNYMIFTNEKRIGALVKRQGYYVRVDAFNESGITTGNIFYVK